ncbi:MAG: transposase-like protein, partial [Myxococcota bacterium]
MGTSKRRRHTAQERSEAVAKAGELGLTAAAKALGMSKTNIWRWLKQSEDDADAVGAAEAESTAVEASSVAVVDDVAEQSAVKSGRVRRVYTPSERARILEHAAQHGPTAAAKKYGCTRWSIREWKRQTQLHAEGKSVTSPVVGSDDDPTVERERRILAVWRKHQGLGPPQIRNQLRRAGLKISTHTVRVTMEEHDHGRARRLAGRSRLAKRHRLAPNRGHATGATGRRSAGGTQRGVPWRAGRTGHLFCRPRRMRIAVDRRPAPLAAV